MQKLIFLSVLLLSCAGLDARTDKCLHKTKVNNKTAAKKLTGKHMFCLQWISWEKFGEAVIINDCGLLKINAIQKNAGNDDYILMQGVITNVDEREFVFDGIIITKIYHLNNGTPCERQGVMSFLKAEGKRYWRLQQIDNPCDKVVDYIDIFER